MQVACQTQFLQPLANLGVLLPQQNSYLTPSGGGLWMRIFSGNITFDAENPVRPAVLPNAHGLRRKRFLQH